MTPRRVAAVAVGSGPPDCWWGFRWSRWAASPCWSAGAAIGCGRPARVAALMLRRTGSVQPCRPAQQATPAAPDFEAAPFAFDPVARASTFLQALADADFRTAYEMSAPRAAAGGLALRSGSWKHTAGFWLGFGQLSVRGPSLATARSVPLRNRWCPWPSIRRADLLDVLFRFGERSGPSCT